jgi:hypothetical protein
MSENMGEMPQGGEKLRIDREFEGLGMSDVQVEALRLRTTTNVQGLLAMRRGQIDAARMFADGATDLQTPEQVRHSREYQVSFDAHALDILEGGKKI